MGIGRKKDKSAKRNGNESGVISGDRNDYRSLPFHMHKSSNNIGDYRNPAISVTNKIYKGTEGGAQAFQVGLQ